MARRSTHAGLLLALLAMPTMASAANGRLALDPQGTNFAAEPAGTASPSALDRTSFTAEAWVRVAGPPALGGIGSSQMAVLSDGAYELFIEASGGTYVVQGRIWHRDATTGALASRALPGTTLVEGEWTHLAIGHDAATNRCSTSARGIVAQTVNCVPGGRSLANGHDQLFGIGLGDAGSATGSRAAQPGSAATRRNAFNGSIDEVRISNVNRLTGLFRPRTRLELDANTVALWRFDEPAGATSFRNEAAGGAVLAAVALAGGAGPPTVKLGGPGFVRGDLDGDERADLLWRLADGRNYAWLVIEAAAGGAGRASVRREGSIDPAIADPAWRVEGQGDFNGDGLVDLLWRHDSGLAYLWFLDGRGTATTPVSLVSFAQLPRNLGTWQVAAIDDFDRDGRDDLVLRDRITGELRIWYLRALPATGAAEGFIEGALPTVSDLRWRIVGAGDCNGDGSADLVWRRSDGRHYVWNVDGRGPTGGNVALLSYGALPPLADENWVLGGVGDFNGDGKRCDLTWRNRADGRNVVWHIDSSNARLAADGSFPLLSGGVLPTITDRAWTLAAVGQFDGDGQSDLLWRHEDGRLAVWYVDGARLGGSGLIPLLARDGQFTNPAPAAASISRPDGRGFIDLRAPALASISISANTFLMVASGSSAPTLSITYRDAAGAMIVEPEGYVELFANDIPQPSLRFTTRTPGDYVLKLRSGGIESNAATVRAREDKDYPIITLPIVFHVVHFGEPVGTGTNLSQAAIDGWLEYLNRAYSNQTGSTDPNAVDMRVRFRLARFAPDGALLAEPGIRHIDGSRYDNGSRFTTPWDIAGDRVFGPNEIWELMQDHYWDPRQYISLFLYPDFQRRGSAASPRAFADNPYPGLETVPVGCCEPWREDFGALKLESRGTPSNGPHEVGHTLGLLHPMAGVGCESGQFPGDYVDDTFTYVPEYEGGPGPACPGNQGTMVSNTFMDYRRVLLNTFTYGQRERVQWVLRNARWLKDLPQSTK